MKRGIDLVLRGLERLLHRPTSASDPNQLPQPAVMQVLSSVANPKPQQYAYGAIGELTCRPMAAVANTCAADGTAGAESQALTWNDEGRLAKTTLMGSPLDRRYLAWCSPSMASGWPSRWRRRSPS